ncbi:MAG: DUF2961 domain-containing protein [Planctomycetota bacterium]
MLARNWTTVFIACAFAAAASPTSADVGYGVYVDWAGWARLHPGERAGLASSYDRSGGNQDYNQYEWPEGFIEEELVVTAKTIEGPGVIYRFWMPHRTAVRNHVVRMYFDGEATPRIDTTSDVIFDEGFAYFSAPFVDTCAGGQVCYEPIFFAESLEIETNNQPSHPHYYQYTYATLPPGTPVTSYTGTLSPEQQATRTATVAMFADVGQHPAENSPVATSEWTPATSIPPDGDLTLIDLAGPGVVRRLNLLMNAATDDELSALRLVVTYDGESTPAIDMPVAQFFGAGNQRATYKSLPIGTDSPDGFYCYWPMPFRQAVSILLHNTSATAISIDSALVEYDPVSVGPSMCYLKVHAFTDYRSSGQVYHPILSVPGRGHYVGSFLFVEQSSYSFWMLEGDEIITVDGTDVLYGTGLEDAYNGGYYYNWVGIQEDEPEGSMPQSATRPLSGILYVHREEGVNYARADQYRWYIADRIPFCDSIEVKIENQYAQVGSEWTSVAFWYERPEPEVPGDLDNTGDVEATDLAMFVDVLLGLDDEADRVIASDLNGDCTADGLDIQGFLEAMLSP